MWGLLHGFYGVPEMMVVWSTDPGKSKEQVTEGKLVGQVAWGLRIRSSTSEALGLMGFLEMSVR